MVLTGYDFAKDKYCSANDRLAGPFTTLPDAKTACDQDNLCEMIEDWGCDGSGYHTCKNSDSDHYGIETCVWIRQYDCKDVYSTRDCNTVKHTGACASNHYSYCKESCSCDTCSPNPCKNNGTCYTYNSGWIVCLCQEHWTGLRCEYYDAYLEISGSRCLRTDKINRAFNAIPDGIMTIDYAQEECSKNQRCVGIEYVFSSWTDRGLKKFYQFCLDSIYTSTAWDKYENITNQVYKKVEDYVFPDEFLSVQNNVEINGLETTQTHSSYNIMASYGTERDCKLHCASEKRCCGCMTSCWGTCKWNAITDCEQMGGSKPADKQILTKKPICIDIQLNIVGNTQSANSTSLKNNSTVRWKLGSCSSLNSIEEGATYQFPAIYNERCCLEPGIYTLVCYNNPPARGWKNAYILVKVHRYCDDFISYKSFQKILVATLKKREFSASQLVSTKDRFLEPTKRAQLTPEYAITESTTPKLVSQELKLHTKSLQNSMIKYKDNCYFFDGYMQGGVAKYVENITTEQDCQMGVQEEYPEATGVIWYTNNSCWAEFGEYMVYSSTQRTCRFQKTSVDNFGSTKSQHRSSLTKYYSNNVWDMKLNLPGETLSVGTVYLQAKDDRDIDGTWTIGTSFTRTNVPVGIQCNDIQPTTEVVNGHSGFFWLKCNFGGQSLLVPPSGTVYSKILVRTGEARRMDTGASAHTSVYYQNGISRKGFTSFFFSATKIEYAMVEKGSLCSENSMTSIDR